MRFLPLLLFWWVSATAFGGESPEPAITLEDPRPLHLRFGGEGRVQFERFHHFDWDPANGSDGYWLQRYFVDADLTLTPRLRSFTQIGSSLVDGKEFPLSPVERDEFTVQQLFLEIDARSTRIRMGRQEIRLGAQRLVGVREGPNVRRSWDGVRVLGEAEAWNWTAFYLRPVEDEPGVLDDSFFVDDTEFWGFYTTWETDRWWAMDLYYLGLLRGGARYATAEGLEERHTLGTRLSGTRGKWDAETEFMGQFGGIDGKALLAGSIAGDLGYTISDWPFVPRLGLQASVSSGTRGDGESVETFSPLFPRGNYFGENLRFWGQ
ncbi:MAG: alginate export family protein [Verrucomicrobiota bacterium]